MRLVFVETMPPHMVRVVEIPNHIVARGHQKVAWTLALWQRYLHTNKWPGYARQIEHLCLPTYSAKRWDDRLNPDNLSYDQRPVRRSQRRSVPALPIANASPGIP
jgi:hypothetical protein